jgi:hypothetical protein
VLYAVVAAALVALAMAAFLPPTLRPVAEGAVIAVGFAALWCWLRANRRALADGKPLTNIRG